jgi:hypothetical protein
MHETANEAVLFAKEFLETHGYPQFAEQLVAFTPVNNDDVAQVVRSILKEMQPRVRGEAAEYVGIALSTVERAFGSVPVLVAISA